MAALYPSAGSAYTYVGRSLNRHAGFLIGWAMFLDYLLVPLICTIYGAVTLEPLAARVPLLVHGYLLFSAGMTAINLGGIRFTARASTILCASHDGCYSGIHLARDRLCCRETPDGRGSSRRARSTIRAHSTCPRY